VKFDQKNKPKKSGKGVLSKEERIARERKYKVCSMETAERDYLEMITDFNTEQQESYKEYFPQLCSNLEDLHEDLLKRANQIQLNTKDTLAESVRLVSAAYGSVCYHDKESFPDIISSEHRLILDNIRNDHPRCIPVDKLPKKFLDSKNGSDSRGSSIGINTDKANNFTSPAASEKFKHNPHIQVSPRPSQSPPAVQKSPELSHNSDKFESDHDQGSLGDSFDSDLGSHLYEKIDPISIEPGSDVPVLVANKKDERKLGRMLYDFDGTDSNGNNFPDAVKCKKEDLIEILEDSSNDNWSKVKILHTMKIGFVPTQFLEIISKMKKDSVLKNLKIERIING